MELHPGKSLRILSIMPDLCFYKTCRVCGAEFITDQPKKRQCHGCDRRTKELHQEARKERVRSERHKAIEASYRKPAPKLTADEVCKKAKEEGLTYGQYLYKHSLYHNTVDNTANPPREALTYTQAKALADAEGLSYREYMARR